MTKSGGGGGGQFGNIVPLLVVKNGIAPPRSEPGRSKVSNGSRVDPGWTSHPIHPGISVGKICTQSCNVPVLNLST